MLRTTLARSAWRTGVQSRVATRAFSATASRPAEVELTIGTILSPLPAIDAWNCTNSRQMERKSRLRVSIVLKPMVEEQD